MNQIGSLDELIESLSKHYNISSDRISKIRLELEEIIYQYLQKELLYNKNEEITLSSSDDINSEVIIEKIVNSDNCLIKLNESSLVKFIRNSTGYTYTLLEGIDVSKLNPEILIESWNCSENGISKLLENIKESIG